MSMQDWTRDYFERGYAQRWGLPSPSDQVRLETDGLWNLLRLEGASRVVDIGCGHGRHALGLAERGADVVGLDSADVLLRRGEQLAADRGTRVRWVRADMRRLPFPAKSADAVTLMDAFGFFDTEEEHAAVLREAHRILTNGGRLLLKVVNGAPVVAAFRETEREERDGVVVSVSNSLTAGPARLIQRISFSGRRGHGEYERRQRLYSVEELRAAVEHAGFAVERVFASAGGAPFDSATSTAMWMVGQRFSAV